MARSIVRVRLARGLLIPAVLLVLVAGVGSSSHAAGATVCRASFRASFSPALAGATSGNGALRIAGSLSDCVGGAAPSASISAGNVWTDTATGFQWQEPVGTIAGSCINNHSAATTIARWSDGGISITNYTSDSLTYGIATNGVNVASVVLTAVNKQAGQSDTLTVNATRDVGATMAGLLFASDPNDPVGSSQGAFSACSGAGLTSAPLNGFEAFAG